MARSATAYENREIGVTALIFVDKFAQEGVGQTQRCFASDALSKIVMIRLNLHCPTHGDKQNPGKTINFGLIREVAIGEFSDDDAVRYMINCLPNVDQFGALNGATTPSTPSTYTAFAGAKLPCSAICSEFHKSNDVLFKSSGDRSSARALAIFRSESNS